MRGLGNFCLVVVVVYVSEGFIRILKEGVGVPLCSLPWSSKYCMICCNKFNR